MRGRRGDSWKYFKFFADQLMIPLILGMKVREDEGSDSQFIGTIWNPQIMIIIDSESAGLRWLIWISCCSSNREPLMTEALHVLQMLNLLNLISLRLYHKCRRMHMMTAFAGWCMIWISNHTMRTLNQIKPTITPIKAGSVALMFSSASDIFHTLLVVGLIYSHLHKNEEKFANTNSEQHRANRFALTKLDSCLRRFLLRIHQIPIWYQSHASISCDGHDASFMMNIFSIFSHELSQA